MAKTKKTLFDVLYSAKEDVLSAMQKPSRVKMLRRVAERVEDEVEGKKISFEAQLAELEYDLANTSSEDAALAVYKRIVHMQRELDEAKEISKAVKAVHEKLFSAAPAGIPEPGAEA